MENLSTSDSVRKWTRVSLTLPRHHFDDASMLAWNLGGFWRDNPLNNKVFTYVVWWKHCRVCKQCGVGLTCKISISVILCLTESLFDLIMEVSGHHIKEQPPLDQVWCMLLAEDIVMCSTRREEVERKLWNGEPQWKIEETGYLRRN